MPNAWMIRAGEGGHLSEKFSKGFVAIGWHQLGDLSKLKTAEEIRGKYSATYLTDKKGAASGAVAMIYKFRQGIKTGDWVLTYNREKREYSLGKISSDYIFNSKLAGSEYPHVREVKWEHHISRDTLKPATKNSLGLTMRSSLPALSYRFPCTIRPYAMDRPLGKRHRQQYAGKAPLGHR